MYRSDSTDACFDDGSREGCEALEYFNAMHLNASKCSCHSRDLILSCLYIGRASAAVAEKQLQVPHGGTLQDLMAPAEKHADLKASATKTIQLSDRNACDVELLTVG